jgi:murein L,D-transpeptidase YcbB/YkuD
MRRSIALTAAAGLWLAACDRAPPTAAPKARPAAAAPVQVAPEIAAFYRERGFRTLWMSKKGPRPEARALVAALAEAEQDGLDPARYDLPTLWSALEAAESGEAASLARAELLLSSAFARYAAEIRKPKHDIFYVDAALRPRVPRAAEALEAAADAPSLSNHLRDALTINPLYKQLRRSLAVQQVAGASAAEMRLIAANLERARIIQPTARRYIIVDSAGARLWLIEDGRIRGRMRTIVGKKGQETPEMAGLIRFTMLRPYWNLPHDLTRERVAKRVLRQGTGFIARERLQILSDWSPSARPIGPSAVDWSAVASGRHKLRVRQLPGPGNGMGEMKFMMPNRLGIYLHDTPNKAAFESEDRRISSGCVRVEDARRLARWLFKGEPPEPRGTAPEQRVDLPEPVPVYITYLTAVPAERGGILFQPDVYGRDPALLAAPERG